eukprot:CCRYP_018518-RA/>CCRYP_018518-RA protein AED:0.48 eAED:0.45 QI:0/0/0/1/0/0/2/0/123
MQCHRVGYSDPYRGHFIGVFTGVSSDFPIHQWDELIPQTTLTMNSLRRSNIAPTMSAYTYHCGQLNYNQMPLAPMGPIPYQANMMHNMGRALQCCLVPAYISRTLSLSHDTCESNKMDEFYTA